MFSYEKRLIRIFSLNWIIPEQRNQNKTEDSKRASQFASQGGYMTVEASLVIPVFLIILMGFALWIQVFMVEEEIQRGVTETGKYLARQMYLYQKIDSENKVIDRVSTFVIRSKWREYVDEDFLEKSCLKGGIEGISFSGSKYDGEEDKIKVYAKYKLYFPLTFLGNYEVLVQAQTEQKAFTGFDNPKEEYVYVTESGSVFHTDRNCTHIALVIRKEYGVESYLNGKKGYAACERCTKHYDGLASYFYITKYGKKYHTSLQCSGLKRTIKKVKLGDTKGLGKCMRCQQREEG